MSIENKKTIEVYKKTASKYLENCKEHEAQDREKARRKKEKLQMFIRKSFSSLPKGSKILEIGSASGENAKYISSLGYKVTASDIADDFIKESSSKGLETINFNILEDMFYQKYSGIFCWRVFVHFTKEDVSAVLKKIYNALEKDGILIFNAINRETRKVENEWVDFPKEYHLGIDRFYNYFYKEDLDILIKQVGFRIIDFHKEGGENNNKWLVYVLKK